QMFWHRYSAPGTYTVTAWVEDAIGRRASDSCRFTWTRPAPPTRPPATPTIRPEIVPNPAYQFERADDGQPITWAPCTVMHWSYNPAGEPSPATIKVVRAALAKISAASGIDMVEDHVIADVSDPRQVLAASTTGEVIIGWAPQGSPAIPQAGSS